MNDLSMQAACLILNGKASQNPEVREAVEAMRKIGFQLAVRVTWEAGDGLRFVEEACREGAKRIIAGGGDGTVNEIVNALMQFDEADRPPLGILPLGSANDFARGACLPLEARAALHTALSASSHAVDVASLGSDYFINMASGGFGAEITNSTPLPLKRLLGGGAYSLMGMINVWRYQPYLGRLCWADGEFDAPLFLLAIGNGSQAGGGQRLTPDAKLDDGLLNALFVRHFTSLREMRQLLAELENIPHDGEFVRTARASRFWFEGESAFPLNLDGEPRQLQSFEVSLNHRTLRLLVPSACPLLLSSSHPQDAMS